MLFLQEQKAAPAEVQSTLTFAEGVMCLAESIEYTAMITESLLQADYIIEKRAATLEEAEATEAKESFWKKAVETVKKAVEWAKAKLADMYAAIQVQFKAIVAKVKTKLASGNAVITKGALEALDKQSAALDKVAAAAGKITVETKADFDAAVAEYEATKGKVEGSETETVALSKLLKAETAAQKVAHSAATTAAGLQSAMKDVGAAGTPSDEGKAALAEARLKVAAFNKLGSCATATAAAAFAVLKSAKPAV